MSDRRMTCPTACSLLLITLASCAAPTPHDALPPDSIPARWLRAVQQQDWSAMGDMLAERAIYADTTKRDFDTEPYYVTGRQAIVELRQRAAAGTATDQVQFTLLDHYETGGVTVLHLNLDVEDSGESWGIQQETITLSCRVMTVLTVDDGKIVHVHDHADWAGAMEQVERMKSAKGG
ncbi:MAG: nuclear transport factor 2 family protein [Myxococcota bacterium]